MSQTNTDWGQWYEQLGSELYNSPDAYQRALPELQDLHRCGKEYHSSYKLDGTKARKGRDEKTIIQQCRPLVIIEHGEPARNIIKLVSQRNGLEWIDAAKYVAGLVGMELPEADPEQQKKWEEQGKKRTLMEEANQYFVWCLHNAPTAEPQREYLRGRFTEAEIDEMGLGYIPSKDNLAAYLSSKGYERQEIETRLLGTLNRNVGSTHTITIPIRKAGYIDSFIFRHHNQPEAAGLKKYQYQSGEMSKPLSYIPTRLDGGLVIVEGQLDCLHLLAAGIKNVVATGTNHISKEAVEDAHSRGAKSYTLLYDADPTDKDPQKNYDSRHRAVSTILDTLRGLGEHRQRIYVAELPQQDPTQKIDPDSYLHDAGADAVRSLLDNAKAYYDYELDELLERCQTEAGTSKQLDTFKDDAFSIYDTIEDGLSRKEFCKHIEQALKDWADPTSVEEWLENGRARKRAADAQKEYTLLLARAADKAKEGKLLEAQKLQDQAAAVMGEADAERQYTELLAPTTRASLIDGLKRQPPALHTGLCLRELKQREREGDNEILLPSGAISIVAAPTSHGKTTMLVSLAVNAAKRGPSKKYLLLSYEEAVEAITLKALSSWAGLEYSANNVATIKSYLTSGGWYGYQDSPELLEGYKQNEAAFFEAVESGRLLIKYTDAYCETLCSSIRRIAAAEPLGAVFIDYVQYLELQSSQRNYRRDEELSKVCRMLKDVAVETGLPIVLGAQFNRAVTDPAKLALANIGEGGDIERKAAYVLGFWNNDMPYMTTKDSKPNMEEIHKISNHHVYDIDHPQKNRSITAVVLKNRSGIGLKAGENGLLSFNGNIGTIGTYEGRTAPDGADDGQLELADWDS